MMKILGRNMIMKRYYATVKNNLMEVSQRAAHQKAMDQIQTDAKSIVGCYKYLNQDEKHDYISFLATDCSVDHLSLKLAISKYEKNGHAYVDVRNAATPLYSKIFQSIGNLESGVKFVCDFRGDVLELISSNAVKHMDLLAIRRLETVLRELLTLWFCFSNLKLVRLTWETPADILQKVAKNEAVHPVQGLIDMQRRLGPGRRCFVFYHAAMPREPLVIVYVALTDGISDSVQKIMKEEDLSFEDEKDANTAIYYSVTSTQTGLKGIDLGNLLIKQVAAELMKENSNIVNHSTLSPIPGFRNWLLRSLRHSEFGEVLDDFVVSALRSFPALVDASPEVMRNHLISLIETNDISKYSKLKDTFTYLAAIYLTKAKNSAGHALNPVTNFHLRNGAEIYRLNFGGDISKRGIEQSLGLMVNYRYVMENVTKNSTNYVINQQITLGTDFALKFFMEEKAKI